MSVAIIPVGQEWADIKNLSQVLVSSGFLPKAVDTPQKAVAIMLMGRELGVGPMEAFSKISVIQGKPTVGAELMKAMVHKKLPTARFSLVKSDDKICTFSAARPGDTPIDFSYTLEEAKAMGLVNKDNWQKQPKTMLRWRCISQVCRVVFPDCLSGISYTPEELGADVNENGEVIEVVSSQPALSKTATTIEQINKDDDAATELKQKDTLYKTIIETVSNLTSLGFKESEILTKLNIKNWADLKKEDSLGLASALDVLTELQER